MNRRQFLKGLGLGAGAGLLLPFYNNVLRADEANGLPRRFVIFVEGNGIEPRAFLSSAIAQAIQNAGGDTDNHRYLYKGYKHNNVLDISQANLGDAPSLSPLLGTNGQSDLTNKAAVILGLSSKISGGGHSTECGALSCTRSGIGLPAGQTIDDLLANVNKVHNQTPFNAVRLGVTHANKRLMYSTCAFGAKRPAPIISDPTAAFNTLFGSVSTGAGQEAFSNRSELLDFARVDVQESLRTFSGNSRERQKLETYLASLELLIKRQGTITQMRDRLQTHKPAEPDEGSLYLSGDPLDRLQAQANLAASALLGGLTNVVVIAMGTGTSNFSLEYDQLIDLYPDKKMMKGHDLRHGAESGNPDCINVLHQITQHGVSALANIARALENAPEMGAEGSMLDHTVMLYLSDNGEKHHSSAEEWPMLMLGGQRLKFKTDGRALVYPANGESNNRQVSNMFNTLGHCAGVDLNDFGAETTNRIAQGPLSELWG